MSINKKEYVSSLSKFKITTIKGDGVMENQIDEPIGPIVTRSYVYSREGDIKITLDKNDGREFTLSEDEMYHLFREWISKVDRGRFSPDERGTISKILKANG